MRFIVLALSLSFTCLANAKTLVYLNELAPHNAHGTLTFKDKEKVNLEYGFLSLKKNQAYAIFVYAKGNCSNYSDLIQAQVIKDETGKIEEIDPYSTAFQVIGNTREQTTSFGGYIAHRLKFFQFELSGKVFVLEEVTDTTFKQTGVAVACGIHP